MIDYKEETIMKNDLISNTSKRLPIVLCLDISPSMSINKRIVNLNEAISLFYKELKSDPKVLNSVEVAVVTFSTYIEENTDFESLGFLENKTFTVVREGGTNLSTAVLTSMKKIEDRVIELNDKEIDNYLPFLVLVTDGDPDQTDSQPNLETAIQTVQKHCEISNYPERLIAPYIIGVGENVADASLDRFAEKFTGRAIIIDGDASHQQDLFKELFVFISNSVKNSLRGGQDLKSLYESIQRTAAKQSELIHKKRKLM